MKARSDFPVPQEEIDGLDDGKTTVDVSEEIIQAIAEDQKSRMFGDNDIDSAIDNIDEAGNTIIAVPPPPKAQGAPPTRTSRPPPLAPQPSAQPAPFPASQQQLPAMPHVMQARYPPTYTPSSPIAPVV